MKNIVELIKHIKWDTPIKSKIYWWSSLIICFFLATHIISSVHGNYHKFLGLCFPNYLSFLLGVLVGMLLWGRWKKYRANRQSLDGAFEIYSSRQGRKDAISGLVLMIIFAIIIFAASLCWSKPSIVASSWLYKFVDDFPGGIFTFITGFATVIGTLIAIQTIIEMKHTITSYPQLLERVTELIKNSPDTTEGVRIISYSPLSGFWQVKSGNLKTNFEKELADKNRKIKIICLNEDDHLKLLLTIASKRRRAENEGISDEMVLNFQIRCDNILQLINGDESYSRKMTATLPWCQKTEYCRYTPIRLCWDDMPPYYFFVSDHRAIIVTPVGLPTIEKKLNRISHIIKQINEYKEENNDKKIRKRRTKLLNLINNRIERNLSVQQVASKQKDVGAHVETLGFETTDRSIIQNLQKVFDDLESFHETQENGKKDDK